MEKGHYGVVKRILILSVFALVILFLPKEVFAATWTDSETGITWNYTQNGTNAENVYVTNWSSLAEKPETLVIPETIAGKTVTKIRGESTNVKNTANSYRTNIIGSTEADTTVKSIELPEGLKEIGANTFANFSGITSIVIPNSVENICEHSFEKCSELEEVTLPASGNLYNSNSVWYNSDGSAQGFVVAAFYECNKVSKVTITPGTTGILGATNICTSNYGYFTPWGSYNNRTEVEIIIEEGVTKISDYAFNSSYGNIVSVHLPDTIKVLGQYLFSSGWSRTNLKQLNLPDSLETISDNCFYGCTMLEMENLILPSSLTTLGQKAFYNNSKIKGKLVIPDSITEIPAYTFFNC